MEIENGNGKWSSVLELVFEDKLHEYIQRRKRHKKEEANSRNFFKAIDEMPYVIDLWDRDDNLIFANKYSQIYGQTSI